MIPWVGHVTRKREVKMDITLENSKRREYLGDLSVGGRMVLKEVSEK
jgi:hypothetical protein